MTMAGQRQPIELVMAKGKKHLTKKEIAERKATELKVDMKNITIPDYLPKNLHPEFTEISEKLLAVGVMTELDEDMLANCLLSKETYLRFNQLLRSAMNEKNKNDMEKYMSLQDKAFKQWRACANDLGLTIASRCKLVAPEVNQAPKSNKFEKFNT